MANEMRLIDADALIADIEKQYCQPCKEHGQDYNEVRCRACWVDDMRLEIDSTPTVDAVEVVHGRWLEDTYCSNCHWFAEDEEKHIVQSFHNYCPNCGADMRGNGDG